MGHQLSGHFRLGKCIRVRTCDRLADVSALAITYPLVNVGVENADGPMENCECHVLPAGRASRPAPRDDKSYSAAASADSATERANLRTNKPVPERRTQSHVVPDDLLESSLDEPKCDGAGRYDTTCDSIELPTDQKVGDSSSSERAESNT